MIDELYNNAFITASGMPAKANLNKDVHMAIKLKRQVQNYKDILAIKEQEIVELKQSFKTTKFKEIEAEAKAYMNECARLRKLTEHAIKVSGEIEYEKQKNDEGNRIE